MEKDNDFQRTKGAFLSMKTVEKVIIERLSETSGVEILPQGIDTKVFIIFFCYKEVSCFLSICCNFCF